MSEMALELIRKAKAEGWKRLDLGNCGIVGSVPDEVGELEQLEELILSNEWWDWETSILKSSLNTGPVNNIMELSSKLPQKLTSLISNTSSIRDISPISHLINLERLNLDSSPVSDIETIKYFVNLRMLQLNGTRVVDISPIRNLVKLDHLSLVETRIKDISPIERLNNLTILLLGHTEISSIQPLRSLTKLKNLYISNSKVTNIGPLESLFQLEYLSISNTEVSDIFPLEGLVQLKELYLDRIFVEDVSSLHTLKQLRKLFLQNTLVKNLEPLRGLSQLQVLYLSDTQVSDISPLSDLENLKKLVLGNTQVSDLSHLKGLLLRNENPLEIKLKLEHQNGIYINNCPLKNPPIEIAAQGNGVILRYWEQMDLSNSLNLKPYINTDVKLILVGNPDSGKTTLAKYLSEGILSDSHAATHGMEVIEWRPDFSLGSLKGEEGKQDGKCLVRIFDFGGQEYYHDTHQLFFTANTAYILMWDDKGNHLKRVKRDKKQNGAAIQDGYFEQHYPLEYWLDAVSHFVSEPIEAWNEAIDILSLWDDEQFELDENWETDHPAPTDEEIQKMVDWAENNDFIEEPELFQLEDFAPHLLVLQTKIDRDDIGFLNQRHLKLRYPFIYDFNAVSLSKKHPQRLEQTKMLIQELLEQVEIIGGELPPQYGWVKEALKHQKSTAYRWSMAKFRKWANLEIGKKNNASKLQLDEEQAFDLVGYLYRIGLLLHFEDSNQLDKQVFVKPNQVMGYIYEILKVAGKQSGRFTELDAMNALDRSTKQIETYKKKGNLDPDTKTILELMRHFKIAFLEGGQKGKYVAPLYLPIKPVQGVQFLLDIYQKPVFRIQYQGYIHKSVVLDFFERFGPNALKDDSREGSEMYYYWRNGIIIKDPSSNTRILVQFSMDNQANLKEPNKAHIDVFELTNEPHSAFLESIMDALSEINIGWNTTTMVTANGKDFVPLEIVENAAAKKQFTFFHEDKIYQLIDFRKFIKLKMPMKKVFISYSKADLEYLKQLENHLSVFKRNGNIATWNDRKLIPGEEWDGKIKKELEEADIILFLISADFLSTDYIWETEMKRALDRDAKGEAKIVPIVVRSCAWDKTPLGKFYSPEKAIPIAMAENQDEAWRIVVEDLEKIMASDTQGRGK